MCTCTQINFVQGTMDKLVEFCRATLAVFAIEIFYAVGYMLFFPSTFMPNFGRIHLNFNAFEYWNYPSANVREVKFDFWLWTRNSLTSIFKFALQKISFAKFALYSSAFLIESSMSPNFGVRITSKSATAPVNLAQSQFGRTTHERNITNKFATTSRHRRTQNNGSFCYRLSSIGLPIGNRSFCSSEE